MKSDWMAGLLTGLGLSNRLASRHNPHRQNHLCVSAIIEPLEKRQLLSAAPVVLNLEPDPLNYFEKTPATQITGSLIVRDADSANLVRAAVQIYPNYFPGEDVLAFKNTSAITGSFNPLTGLLLLTGKANVIDYQAALQSVTYQNLSVNPHTAIRRFEFAANDGKNQSNIGYRFFKITPVNDPPVISNVENTSHAYVEKTPPAPITSLLTLKDVDNVYLAHATVQLFPNYFPAEDRLSFSDTSAISSSWDSNTGTLTLTGYDTVANYQIALRSVKYANTSSNPNTLIRRFQISVNDGGADSNVAFRYFTITPVNDPPAISNTETDPHAYIEKDPATQITATLMLNDIDSATMAHATVQLSPNYFKGEDVLAFANTNAISGTWNASTGTLTLAGFDSVANYQDALRSVTYQNLSSNPKTTIRRFQFVANDEFANSAVAFRYFTVTPVNDPPVISNLETTTHDYKAKSPPTQITSLLTLGDADNVYLAHASVQLFPNYVPGEDVLSFLNTNTITGSWDAATGTMTLTGIDTVANYQAALRAVKYQNLSSNPTTMIRRFQFVVNDGTADSAIAYRYFGIS